MTTPKSSIEKGKRLENFVVDRMIEKGLGKASRSPGSGSGDREKADISTSVIIHERQTGEERSLGIECKNHKVPHIKMWWAQTIKLETGDSNRIPVLVYKLGGEKYFDTKVVIYLDTFLDLVKDNCEINGTSKKLEQEVDNSVKWKLDTIRKKLENCINMIDLGRNKLMKEGEYSKANGNEYLKKAKSIIKDCKNLIEE